MINKKKTREIESFARIEILVGQQSSLLTQKKLWAAELAGIGPVKYRCFILFTEQL